jgi:glucoamylase
MFALKRAALVSSMAYVTMADDQCAVDDYDKVDCKQMSEDQCTGAGCCWKPAGEGSVTPWCYYKAGQVKVPKCSLKFEPKEPFTEDEFNQIRALFEANLDIQGSGMVVAAPDHDTGPGGDYYFAWQRDGALSMNAFMQTSPQFDADVEKKMEDWLSWVERSMNQPPVEDRDLMAEPKFVIPSGVPFPGAWCRPQNDGPGLRAITLMALVEKKPELKERAWAQIQKELDWVVSKYDSVGCDLWEEVQSTDFFWNRYTMRKALLQGSKFAASMSDSSRAETYTGIFNEISGKLSMHIESDGFVFESENRKMDTATIEAFNVGDMDDDMFAPLSNEVVATMVGLTKTFCKEYGLNQEAAKQEIPGVLFGRYPGDSYDGGNPWILLSASVATLLYRQSAAMAAGGKMDVDVAESLKTVIGQDITAKALLGAGDAIFDRMKHFLSNGVHMNEQIGRDDGALKSAKDLTWNYANVLKAIKARTTATATIAGDTIMV